MVPRKSARDGEALSILKAVTSAVPGVVAREDNKGSIIEKVFYIYRII